jgi:hypothetical protein
MGFYAPYLPEQKMMWLIACQTILGQYKDVVRYICRRHLVHWFENKAEHCFSIQFGRMLFEEERSLYLLAQQHDILFIKAPNNQTTKNFIRFVCAAELLAGQHVSLFDDELGEGKKVVKSLCGKNHLLRHEKPDIFQFENTGFFVVKKCSGYPTIINGNMDVIVVADYNALNPKIFFKCIVPFIQEGVRVLAFFSEDSESTTSLSTCETDAFTFKTWEQRKE